MNKKLENKEVMTTALTLLTIGLLLGSLVFFYIARLFPGIHNYAGYIILLLILQVYRSVLGQYCRGIGRVRDFVVGGMLEATFTAIVAIFALYVMNLGIEGYVAGLAAGNLFGIIYFSLRCRIWTAIGFTKYSRKMAGALLVFCLPLMIHGALWWVVNSVNRIFIAEYSGVAEVGIFGVAQKVSGLLAAVITVFIQAWQMSANEEYESEEFVKYVSSIFNGFHLVTLTACVASVAIAIPLIVPIFGEDFSAAAPLIPLLLLSTALSGSASFLGALQMAKMNTRSILSTSLIAGAVVIISNYLFVPRFDAMGAAIAAVLGFSVLLVFRLISVRGIVSSFAVIKLALGISIVLAACIPSSMGINAFTVTVIQFFAFCGLLTVYKDDIKNSIRLFKNRIK